MVSKKISKLVAGLMVMSTLCFTACNSSENGTTVEGKATSKDAKKIGITQIIEHAALDEAREGFIEGLKEAGYENGKNITIDFQNAQGNAMTANTIAQNFASDKKDLIFAVATPVAQAAYNATKDIPIVFTAVTDPVDAGITKSFEKPETNVTGTSDRAPVEEQIELLKKVMPNVKKVGFIYNTGEANSLVQLKDLKAICSKNGIEVIETGITSVNEAAQSLSSILDKIDVLYTPTDNMVASSMPLITEKCFEKNIGVFGAEAAHVKGGAFMTKGVNYKQLGKEAAAKAVEILKGKKPSEIAVTCQEKFEIAINEDAVKKLNLTIPEDVIKEAVKITGGVK
ncbi:putative ABC transport system substrate-binding protein [Hathewaya proteolytica DSM 3090]|uniref:Putative ABC transport system substrate-binding protein n=1 Tax=Hathewaya proteolytica DSM 3090 TaxID=1121331 RepID=A0A1M6ME64_9CLOT|nr:ABC transporter substrate-binding protein [Hathewaya proteolytica]SHJ81603.1 putative ABC transport system substrate-binding protein [Hathewaya proteolytica DSM 3090]